MRRLIARTLMTTGGVFTAAILFAVCQGWRASQALDSRKDEAIALTETFTRCFYANDRACLAKWTTWDDKMRSDPSMLGFVKQVQERLGTRGQATPIEKSWSSHSFTNLRSGTTTTIEVTMSTAFTSDSRATESFLLFEDDSHGLRVKGYRVNSPLMFAGPR